ncbi:MAG: amidohydrolase family protein [Hyphomicrobiaceae bacterium]
MIDFGSTPPVAELNPTSKSHLANYRRVYRSSEERARVENDPKGALGSYLHAYDQAGVATVVIKARDVETTFGLKIRNEDVAAFCRSHAPRFIGFAGVDPHKGMEAVRELEFAVRELGLRGLNIQCFECKLAINDPKLYPLYAKCIELNIPVNIHVGINFSTMSSMEYGRPALLDQVMMHFPELRVVASPPGWPWVTELIGVAWRHPNVHIGIVAMRPKYLAVENSGYEPLLQYGNSVLQDRIIFGSAWPMQPIGQSIAEVEALPLKDTTKRKWLGENAARLLGLG